MNRRSVRIGPGAPSLVLIIAVLSMSILGVLSFLNARQDRQLSERSLTVSLEIAQLNSRSEASLANLDELLQAHPDGITQELLPEGMTLQDGCVFWEEVSGSRVLFCTVSITGEGAPRWTEHRLATEFTTAGD